MKNHKKIIYLVQHGEAKSKDEDPQRPLTEQGRKEVEQIASWAEQAELNIDQIRHSGKLRAQETAEIFAKRLDLMDKVVQVSGISPMDDVKPTAIALQEETQSIMMVSHLPFLNRLASLLLAGDAEKTIVQFRNGGLVGLVEELGTWSLALFVLPDVVREGG